METSDSDNELTIETVLLHYGAPKVPKGSGWKPMRCPFKQYHKDTRASAGVNHGLNIFNCQACPMSGDPITIIRKAEKITRREAIEQARQVFGQSVKDVPRTITGRRIRREPLGNERWKDLLG